MSKFQVIFFGILILLTLAGVILFATFRGGDSTALARVSVWGTFPVRVFNTYLESVLASGVKVDVTYSQKAEAVFYQELLEALAAGRGPDVILLPHDSLLRYNDKIFPIPNTSYPDRTFKDTFVEEGELMLSGGAVLGVPLAIDPLVMYWNRDIFTSLSLLNPPATWGEFYDLIKKLTIRDAKFNISRTALALGEFDNIKHAKDILSALMLQAGSPVVAYQQDGLQSVFSIRPKNSLSAGESSLSFFAQFANPASEYYSWNRALPEAKSMFLAGDLATYIGYASELSDLRSKNASLNMDVVALPQPKDAKIPKTFGRMYSFSLLKNSPRLGDAFLTTSLLTGRTASQIWSNITGMPSARRDILREKQTDAFKAVFYDSTIKARGWLDPDNTKTYTVFKNMSQAVTTGRLRVSEAVNNGALEVNQLLSR